MPDGVRHAHTVGPMDTESQDAYVDGLIQGGPPVFVSDLLVNSDCGQVDAWIANQSARRRFGFLPLGEAMRWRLLPVLVVPLDRPWPWRSDSTLRGSGLYAHALDARGETRSADRTSGPLDGR